jgi:hypothetical protein
MGFIPQQTRERALLQNGLEMMHIRVHPAARKSGRGHCQLPGTPAGVGQAAKNPAKDGICTDLA